MNVKGKTQTDCIILHTAHTIYMGSWTAHGFGWLNTFHSYL